MRPRRGFALLLMAVVSVSSCGLQIEQDQTPVIEALPDSTEPAVVQTIEPTPLPTASATPTSTPSASETATARPTKGRPDAQVAATDPTPVTPPKDTPTSGPTSEPSTAPTKPATTPTPTPTPTPTEPGNAPPVANDDIGSSSGGAIIFIDALANDTDPEGGTLTLISAGTPSHGTAKLENGRVKYTPANGFAGTDTWTYEVSDGEATSSGTISVDVTANRAPEASNDGPVVVQLGGSIDIDVSRNDIDRDHDPMTIQIVQSPKIGSAKVISAGSVRYDAPTSGGGTVTFTYRATDSHGNTSNTATVTVQVNRRPVAVGDDVRTTGTGLVSFNVISGSGTTAGSGSRDSDPDGDALTFTAVTRLPAGTGTLSCGSSGACSWDPPNGCSSVDTTVTYSISDGRGGTASASLRLRQSVIC